MKKRSVIAAIFAAGMLLCTGCSAQAIVPAEAPAAEAQADYTALDPAQLASISIAAEQSEYAPDVDCIGIVLTNSGDRTFGFAASRVELVRLEDDGETAFPYDEAGRCCCQPHSGSVGAKDSTVWTVCLSEFGSPALAEGDYAIRFGGHEARFAIREGAEAAQ